MLGCCTSLYTHGNRIHGPPFFRSPHCCGSAPPEKALEASCSNSSPDSVWGKPRRRCRHTAFFLAVWCDFNPWQVGGWVSTPLKNMSSSIGMMTFPTEWKDKTCSKPPTRWDTSFRCLVCVMSVYFCLLYIHSAMTYISWIFMPNQIRKEFGQFETSQDHKTCTVLVQEVFQKRKQMHSWMPKCQTEIFWLPEGAHLFPIFGFHLQLLVVAHFYFATHPFQNVNITKIPIEKKPDLVLCN